MEYLQNSLERLYQGFAMNTNPAVRDAAKEIERVQFDSFTNPVSITSDGFFHQVREAIRNQNAMENLDKVAEMEAALKSIRRTLDIFNM